jgi:glutathione S-transferase
LIDLKFEKDEYRKKELKEKFETQTLPHHLKLYNEKIASSGSGYLAASGLSWADLHLVNVLEWLGENKEATLANFKHVKELDAKVRANPKVAEWIAKRPKTDI